MDADIIRYGDYDPDDFVNNKYSVNEKISLWLCYLGLDSGIAARIELPHLNGKTYTFVNISGINPDPRCVRDEILYYSDIEWDPKKMYPDDYEDEIDEIHARFNDTYTYTFDDNATMDEIADAIQEVTTSTYDGHYEMFLGIEFSDDKIYVEFGHGS